MNIGVRREQEKHALRNPVVLERLIANGSDLTKPHHIVNVFYAFEENKVPQLLTKLREDGLKIETPGPIRQFEDQTYWLVEASLDLVPNGKRLTEMTDHCVILASQAGVDYDGWYTQVV